MNVGVGNYLGKIIGHGTDMSQSGLPFVWISVSLPGQQDTVTCKMYLASSGGEEKTATCIRMARASLKLCGFDPDTSELSDLDNIENLLVGNEVPVCVSETPKANGGFYTNYNIQLPRGVPKEQSKALTSALRAAKSKGEAPVPPRSPLPPMVPQAFSDLDIARARAAGVKPTSLDDIPFAFIIATLVGGASMFA